MLDGQKARNQPILNFSKLLFVRDNRESTTITQYYLVCHLFNYHTPVTHNELLNTTNVVVCNPDAGSAIIVLILDLLTTLHELLVPTKQSSSWKSFLWIVNRLKMSAGFSSFWVRNLVIMNCALKSGNSCPYILNTRKTERCRSTACLSPDILAQHL